MKTSFLKNARLMKNPLGLIASALCLGLSLVGMHASILAVDAPLYRAFQGANIRAISMGGAYTGIADGAGAIYYNPAGLTMRGSEALRENFDLSNGVFTEINASSMYFSPFGFSDYFQANKDGSSLKITTYGMGRRGSNGVDWGITYKTLSEFNASGTEVLNGWSSDLGIKVNVTNFLQFGAVAKDFLKKDVEIPATFRSGIALFAPNRSMIFSADLVQIKDETNKSSILTNVGLEVDLSDGLKLRSGLQEDTYSLGLNLMLPFLNIDYGYVADQNDPSSARYLLGFKVGQGAKHKRSRQYALFKPKSFAEFRVASSLTGGKSEISLLGGLKIGSNDLLANIREASLDPTCEGFVIRIGSLPSSIAAVGLIQDIRSELHKAKRSGKKIITYLEGWAMLPEYYLASVGNKVVMPELGTISHLGLKVDVKKTKDFLHNFGVGNDILSSGKFKAELQPNSTPLTDEGREHVQHVLENLFDHVIVDIKKERNLKWVDIKTLFDGRILSAKEAKENGLVDAFGYWKQAKDMTKDISKVTAIAPLTEFATLPEPPTIFSPNNRIAVVEIDGPINMGRNSSNFIFGGKASGSDEIEAIFSSIEKNHGIRGVILRVNSPGGNIVAAEQIYQAIEKLKKKGKVIYTSMGNIATSGGYYVAANSDKIVANPGTLTGSIGTISTFQNYEGLEDMLDIQSESIKTGKYMDMFSKHKALNEEEKKMLQKNLDNMRQTFVDRVVENRKFSEEEVDELAQGQVFTGLQAKDVNLIDDIGNFYDTVEQITKAIDIKGEPELVYYRRNTWPFGNLSQLF